MNAPTETFKNLPGIADNRDNQRHTKGTFSNAIELKKLIERLEKFTNSTEEAIATELGQNNELAGNKRVDGNKHEDHYFVRELDGGKRVASLRFPLEAVRDVLNVLEETTKQGATDDSGIRLDVLTWNLGVSWDHTDSYEGAWPFEEVMGVIDDNLGGSGDSIIFLQEVPIREKSLGLHYYFDRLESCLRAWGWEVYTADRGMVKLVTAIRSNAINVSEDSPLSVGHIGRRSHHFPSYSALKSKIADQRELRLINVHLSSNKKKAETDFEDFFKDDNTQCRNPDLVLSAGDFNYEDNHSGPKSGRVISANDGAVADGNNFDYIFLNKDRVPSEVVTRDLSPPRRAKFSDGGHYHLPVKATVLLAEEKNDS